MRWIVHDDKERDAVCDAIRKVKFEYGKPYEIECKKKTKRRTLPQNSLYWLWLTCISQETGNDKEDLHSYYADRYLQRRQIIFTDGTRHEVRGSTTSLETGAFSKYLECIQRDAGELGIQLIGPDSPLFEQFFDAYRGKI